MANKKTATTKKTIKSKPKEACNITNIISAIYFYAVSLISVIILIINASLLLNIALENYVFKVDNTSLDSWEIQECDCTIKEREGTECNITEEEKETCLADKKADKKIVMENRIKRDLAQSISFSIISFLVLIIHLPLAIRSRKK